MIITAGAITKELLTGLVMEITTDIMLIVKTYSTNESTVLHKLLRKTDIETKINVVNLLSNDIEKSYKFISGTALEKALISIHDIVKNIKETLLNLEKALEDYNSRWITFYRNHEYVEIHNTLEEYINILDKRIQLVISCMSLSIYH